MEFKVEGIIKHETTQPYKIELTRGQKGTYAWTITVHAAFSQAAISELRFINAHLCDEYMPPVAPPEET